MMLKIMSGHTVYALLLCGIVHSVVLSDIRTVVIVDSKSGVLEKVSTEMLAFQEARLNRHFMNYMVYRVLMW